MKVYKVYIVGGGGGDSNAANVIRSLDRQAQIHIFTNRDEIGNLPCEIPFVLKGVLSSWESSFAFRDKFCRERKIDRLAVAIAERIPVKQLALLDTCYSPTTGAGYEAVNMALDELVEKIDNE